MADPKTNPTEPAPPALPEGHVSIRVLPKGAGVVSKGLTDDLTATFAKGDIFTAPKEVGDALEAAGLGEVQP